MFPQAGSDAAWTVTILGEEGGKLVVGESSRLFESVHSFSNLDVYDAVACDCEQVVLVDDGLGNGGKWDAHVDVILFVHGGVEVKIFDVDGGEACVAS